MKSNRRQDVTVEIIVGTFVFFVLLVLAVFSIAISKEKLLRKSYAYPVWFPDVGGLKDGENVLLRGLKVGIVKEIRLDETERGGVQVLLQLERPLALHEDYSIEVLSSSMLGGMRVVIHEGGQTPDLPAAGYGKLTGHTPPDLMAAAGDLVQEVRRTLNQGGVMDSLKGAMANIRDISEKANKGTGLVARILNEDGLYKTAVEMMEDIDRAAKDLAAITADVKQGKGLLGSLVSEKDNVYDTVKTIVSNANTVAENLAEISTRLEKGEGTVGRLLAKEDDGLYDDLRKAVAGLRDAASTFERNDSTISKLFKEDKLYEEIRRLIQDARATVDDFRETSPITTFSSIFFGAF